jgi:L-lactate dehydrogenase complex protein LldG
MGNSKSSILEKIRAALKTSTRLPFPEAETKNSPFHPPQQDIVVEFAEQFTGLQGKFDFCSNGFELADHFETLCSEKGWKRLFCTDEKFSVLIPESLVHNDIATCDAAITGCEALVARTGSLMLSSQNSGRITSVYAPVHICIAYTSQLVYDISEALQFLQLKYKEALPSFITFATGPSRTADIEKTLVVGVHGPKEVYLFLVDDLKSLPAAP